MADTKHNASSLTARDMDALSLALSHALVGNVGAIGELLERVSTPQAVAAYLDGVELLVGELEAELLRRLEELSTLSRRSK
jgi:hypothetical protein